MTNARVLDATGSMLLLAGGEEFDCIFPLKLLISTGSNNNNVT